MAGYRLHCLDGGNHIVERHDFDADNDRAALDYARARYPHSALELWELGRLVAKLPPNGAVMNGFCATGQVI